MTRLDTPLLTDQATTDVIGDEMGPLDKPQLNMTGAITVPDILSEIYSYLRPGAALSLSRVSRAYRTIGLDSHSAIKTLSKTISMLRELKSAMGQYDEHFTQKDVNVLDFVVSRTSLRHKVEHYFKFEFEISRGVVARLRDPENETLSDKIKTTETRYQFFCTAFLAIVAVGYTLASMTMLAMKHYSMGATFISAGALLLITMCCCFKCERGLNTESYQKLVADYNNLNRLYKEVVSKVKDLPPKLTCTAVSIPSS